MLLLTLSTLAEVSSVFYFFFGPAQTKTGRVAKMRKINVHNFISPTVKELYPPMSVTVRENSRSQLRNLYKQTTRLDSEPGSQGQTKLGKW